MHIRTIVLLTLVVLSFPLRSQADPEYSKVVTQYMIDDFADAFWYQGKPFNSITVSKGIFPCIDEYNSPQLSTGNCITIYLLAQSNVFYNAAGEYKTTDTHILYGRNFITKGKTRDDLKKDISNSKEYIDGLFEGDRLLKHINTTLALEPIYGPKKWYFNTSNIENLYTLLRDEQ
ncbi:MAG: hypothetical protein R3A45_10225 [Bdellovibrionota bacterium]